MQDLPTLPTGRVMAPGEHAAAPAASPAGRRGADNGDNPRRGRRGQRQGEAPPGAPTRRRPARRWTILSALLFVVLPTVAAALYYALFAASQYAVELRFAVRSSSTTTPTDSLGAITGLSVPTATSTDSYILMDYVRSREMVDKLEKLVGLRKIYANPDADFYARARPNLTSEQFVEYWRSMVQVNYDTTSQIVSAEVRAFNAEDAKKVATALLSVSEDLVNELSSKARNDSVKFAQAEVTRIEGRLKASRLAMRKFRDKQLEFDPVKKAEAQLATISQLEQELSKAKAKLTNLRTFMGETAPSVMVVKSEIAALEGQIREERSKIGSDSKAPKNSLGASIGGLVADYEEILVEREFAEKAYVSALTSLEQARHEASRQQRYLATFVNPTLPQEAVYPKRLANTALVFGVLSVLWAIGLLLGYAIRDHAV